MTLIMPDASPYDLETNMLRDGRPRDVVNQRIAVNDTVRVWSVQMGWSSDREYFVRHIMPMWVPGIVTPQEQAAMSYYNTHELPRGRYIFSFLLAPQLDEIAKTTDTSYLGNDALEIYSNTVLLITEENDMLVIEEGMAAESIKVIVRDYETVKIRAGEPNIIYNSDTGQTPTT
jgi:hypothetical protein